MGGGSSGIRRVWDERIDRHTVAMSFSEFLKWTLSDYVHLYEHFEAIDVASLKLEYTETPVGGGTVSTYLDNEPSCAQLASGAVQDDSMRLQSDRTVSLTALGGTKLIIEFRCKINSEAQITWFIGLVNTTTNADVIRVYMNTLGGAPRPNGVVYSTVDGVNHITDLGLAAAYDLTQFHVYRIEITPSTRIDVYVDDALVGSEVTGAEVPVDQSWIVDMYVLANANADKTLTIDYYKVWSE